METTRVSLSTSHEASTSTRNALFANDTMIKMQMRMYEAPYIYIYVYQPPVCKATRSVASLLWVDPGHRSHKLTHFGFL